MFGYRWVFGYVLFYPTSNFDTIIYEVFHKHYWWNFKQKQTISTTTIQITLDLVVETFGNLMG